MTDQFLDHQFIRRRHTCMYSIIGNNSNLNIKLTWFFFGSDLVNVHGKLSCGVNVFWLGVLGHEFF